MNIKVKIEHLKTIMPIEVKTYWFGKNDKFKNKNTYTIGKCIVQIPMLMSISNINIKYTEKTGDEIDSIWVDTPAKKNKEGKWIRDILIMKDFKEYLSLNLEREFLKTLTEQDMTAMMLERFHNLDLIIQNHNLNGNPTSHLVAKQKEEEPHSDIDNEDVPWDVEL